VAEPVFELPLVAVSLLAVASVLAAVSPLEAPTAVAPVFGPVLSSVVRSDFSSGLVSDLVPDLVPAFVRVVSFVTASVLFVASGWELSVASGDAESPLSTAPESAERASRRDCFVRAGPPAVGELADPCAALGMAGLTSMSGVGT
jgi:hypothetical protein